MTPPSPSSPAAPSANPAPRCPRYLSLDFWRGVACLLIVVFHSTFYTATKDLAALVAKGNATLADRLLAGCTSLWVGVPIFFVISGYCISATADSTRRKSSPVRLYFWRRLRRIFPPYWIFLAIAVVAVWLTESFLRPGLFVDNDHGTPHPGSLSPVQWLGTISLTEIWRHHVFGPEMRLFMQHAWTLCYEEQFYAVVGLILLISPRRFFPLATLVTAVVFALEVVPTGLFPPIRAFRRHAAGFFFDGYWLYFAAGIGVYYAINYATRFGRAALAGALLLGVAWGASGNVESRTVSFAFAALLLFLHRWDAPLATAAWSRPISWCGTMCYSLYLVHLPVCKAVSHSLFLAGIDSSLETLLITIPLCMAASLLVAWPFHLWVERRFLNTPTVSAHCAPATAPTTSQPAMA